MTEKEFVKKYNVNPEMDERTFTEILNFNNNVMPISNFIKICKKASKKLDKRIKHDIDIIDPRNQCWGGAFDRLIANIINDYQNKFKYRRCLNHNTERDCVCIDNNSNDIEVKTALYNLDNNNWNGFYTSKCKNYENSPKYNSPDEYDYYLFVRLNRNSETCITKVEEIYFGRICEDFWKDNGSISIKVINKNCVRIL